MSAPFFDIRLSTRLARFELDYALQTDERSNGIFGPSGAGKTTIIECIAGWRRPDSGHVRVGGRVLFDSQKGVNLPLRKRGIGYVPQDVLLFPHWNVRENVLAGRERRRDANPTGDGALLERVLDFLQLTTLETHPVTELSGGERHRVALARALCSEPDLLLLDEPLSSLDLPLRRRVLGDLLRVREEFNVPMLLISHDATEVQVLCERAQWIRDGRIGAEGHPSAIVGEAQGTPGGVDFENVLRGRVVESGKRLAPVEVEGGVTLLVPGSELQAGERVVLGIRADDILVALSALHGLSARNVLSARVEALQESADGMSMHARIGEGASLLVHLTESSVEELGIRPGREVHLVLKSRSIRVITKL